MSNIGPGTKVVCVNNVGAEELAVGQTYTVRNLCCSPHPGIGLILAEISTGDIHGHGGEACYKHERFRPIDDIDHSESMALLRKLADVRKVRVDA